MKPPNGLAQRTPVPPMPQSHTVGQLNRENLVENLGPYTRDEGRYETYGVGNGYVGPGTAQDDSYVSHLLQHLVKDWQEGAFGYIDI